MSHRKKSPHCIGHGNAIFRSLFEKIHRSFTFPRLRCLFASLRKSPSISSDRKPRFEQPVLKIFSMAKNSHRPNGQRHQVSSLHSAALRVILVLEFICWEVASPSSAFAVPAMLLHRGTTSGFQAFGGYAFGCVLKTAQTADTGVTVRGLHFVVRLF